MNEPLKLSNGDPIPAIGYGTWQLENGTATDCVKTAIDIGYRHLDCAHIYGNEADIGLALDDICGTVGRDNLWITSKLWNDSHQPDRVEVALKTTLDHLRLDALDLYLMHWPIAHQPGKLRPESGEDFMSLDDVPLIETWTAMENCLKQGLCRYIGVANFNVPKLNNLLERGSVSPAMNQVESHPFLQQRELVEFCRRHQIGFTAYSPLGSLQRPERLLKADEPSLFEHPDILAIANRHQKSPAQILLSWAIGRGTIPIPKSSNPDRMRENFESQEIQLDEEDRTAIDLMNKDYRFIDGTFWAMPGSPYTTDALWNE